MLTTDNSDLNKTRTIIRQPLDSNDDGIDEILDKVEPLPPPILSPSHNNTNLTDDSIRSSNNNLNRSQNNNNNNSSIKNRSLSSSLRSSPVLFPSQISSTNNSLHRASPPQLPSQQNQSSLSRQSSLRSTYSEAACRSSTFNSPNQSPQPFNPPPTPASDETQRKKSRHPSFSYHGLEGKGSTGSAVERPDYSEAKIVVAMVGLPARGKSYLSNKLQRYLKWLEFNVKVFNVGQYRREKYFKMAAETGSREDQSANFFDPQNQSASQVRERLAAECLESLIDWLKSGGGNVGIHDATNSTKARRDAIVSRVKKEKGIKLIFLESICTDPSIIQANVDVKVASGDPDYDGMPREKAREDFLRRIQHYESHYETIDDEQLSYCKFVNVGYEVTINRIDNYLSSRVAFYLMNLHVTPRSIFFTRHGESQYNVEGKIGGDSCLSKRGSEYAKALPALIANSISDAPLTVWTSTLKRTIQTAGDLPYPKLTWKSLDELDAGVCDGMTYEEIEATEHYPEDYAQRDDDKFNYRYRGGESYRDVVVRLEPVIMELERQENILIVCHQAVLRCLYAYFHNLSQDELPYIKIPLHTVIKLTPKAYGCDEERFTVPIEAVDTTRPKPVKVQQQIDQQKIESLGPSPSTRP
ncbi:fructose-6-phosphate 2-kinase [Phakopsora pachyrhizi]|uniref:fructose-2,6-bisphosphate 2-phosphatase n=1 Tax=Phakopsora pachyrhizi TaxID=170000 RepID=A0AAV0B2X1_PHAPC|nr:fructose-6-phosphate 2-kinase [Phakopsora pachyrhizi]CAH7676809.1 fructose-6-phosphate 2-kinase [Phakopsora pachyrhizi]